jgi:hypothetical protein
MSSFRLRLSVPLTIGIFAVIAFSFANPSFATKGREAVGMCIDSTAGGARCEWSVNDKGEIDICNKNGCVFCPSAEGECSVAKTRPRPKTSLPAGVTVTTALGEFKVTPRPHTGSLLKPPKDKASADAKPPLDKTPVENPAAQTTPVKAPATKASGDKAPAEKK